MLPACFAHLSRSASTISDVSAFTFVLAAVAREYGVPSRSLVEDMPAGRTRRDCPAADLREARRVAIYLAVTVAGMSRYAVAERMQRDARVVRRIVTDVVEARERDSDFDRRLDELEISMMDLKEELAVA